MRAKKVNTRKSDFWHSNAPLTSQRVRNILSEPKDSQKLAKAVREVRSAKTHPKEGNTIGVFTISHKG